MKNPFLPAEGLSGFLAGSKLEIMRYLGREYFFLNSILFILSQNSITGLIQILLPVY